LRDLKLAASIDQDVDKMPLNLPTVQPPFDSDSLPGGLPQRLPTKAIPPDRRQQIV
jgi:hypothetical protein